MKKLIEKIKAKTSSAKRLKNKALLKRGSYALAVSAVVVAGIIVLNVLVSALADRFHLEFDLSLTKENSISQENLEYIKAVDKPVTINILASKDDYIGGYMDYYAQNYYNATDSTGEYYEQTLRLIEQYESYNDNITVEYVDPQDPSFNEIKAQYSGEDFIYGDILVTASFKGGAGNDISRHKVITFSDIYQISDPTGMAAYGYSNYTVAGSDLETALTSAIASVTAEETKKVAFLAHHSTAAEFEFLQENLKLNNYEIVTVDSLVTEIPEDTDAIMVVAPTKDFTPSELDVISKYLNNDGNLGGAFIYFASTGSPALPNLEEFLAEWGIVENEGVLFETSSTYRSPTDPTTMYFFPTENEIIGADKYFVSGGNVPFNTTESVDTKRKITTIAETSPYVAAAPVGAAADWNGYSDDDLKQYPTIIMSRYEDVVNNEEVKSDVIVFAGTDIVGELWGSETSLANLSATVDIMDSATNMASNGISFNVKTITTESFSSEVTEAGVILSNAVFMYAIPLCLLIISIVVFIRRKNK